MADHLAVLNLPIEALKRSATVTSFDPLTLLPALAVVTERLGLIATASTTFEQPYIIARKFASLDHLSNGRAGWNIVTTANPDAALNFGMDDQMEHDERYRRAREFYDVVTGLWDSWDDDAFIRDVESGVFFDPAKMHVLNHKGAVPLGARPAERRAPAARLAGHRAGGRVRSGQATCRRDGRNGVRQLHDDGRRAALLRRCERPHGRLGRDPDHMKILPALLVIVGNTQAEAEAKHALLDSLVHTDSALPNLSMRLGVDASGFDLDATLPPMPQTNAGQSGQKAMIELAARENLTVRQLAQRVGGYGGLTMVGTAATIADQMEAWLTSEACDGFNVMFPFLPAGLEEFVDQVVPELQRRGLFRRDYEGATLRENLGLPRPANRFAGQKRAAE